MDSYDKLVKEAKDAQAELDKRMAADADLLHLAEYVARDTQGNAVPDIVNVTLNKPAVFGANVVASIGSARQQCIVETDNKGIDTHEIENFLDAAMSQADRAQWEAGEPLLNPFADAQFCFRGRSARRVLMFEKNGEVISDIKPWDGRRTYYEKADKGLKWAAYECTRKKSDIEQYYGAEAAAKVTGKQGVLLDVWDASHNEVWVDGAKVKVEGHTFGFTPVALQIVTLGYGAMLPDEGWAKYEGESIFFMIRHIIPQLNMLVSMLQTHTFRQLHPPEQFKNPDGSPSDEPPEAPRMGDVVSVGKGSIEPISVGEIRQAAQMLYPILEKAFQEGSYTDIDIGNVQQPFSAVALVTIGENKDMVYLPRLAAKEMLNQATAEMLVKQALQIGGTIPLGSPGHKRAFATAKLQGEYDIQYKYFVRSPKIDIARMSLAEAAGKWYPREYIYSQVLQVEDPEGMLRDWRQQEAELISPGVKQYRIIRSLLERAEKNNDKDAAREAGIMAMELGVTLDQIRSGGVPQQELQRPAGEPALPLLGEGGQVGGLSPNKMAANLQKMPKEVTNAG